MELYIEYVIFDNFIIDLLILKLTALTLNIRIKKFNLVLASAIGVVFAFVTPYLVFNTVLVFFVKLLMGLIIIIFIKRFKKIADYIAFYILFISYTFAFGGIVFAVFALLNFNININDLIIYNYNFPIGVFLLIISIYLYLLISLIKYVKNKAKITQFNYDISITYENKKYYFQAFLDTGNNLIDETNKKNIIVLSKSAILKLCKNISIVQLILKKTDNINLKNCRLLDIKMVNETTKMIVFDIDELDVFINKKCISYDNVSVGISDINFNDFDCILNKSFVR